MLDYRVKTEDEDDQGFALDNGTLFEVTAYFPKSKRVSVVVRMCARLSLHEACRRLRWVLLLFVQEGSMNSLDDPG